LILKLFEFGNQSAFEEATRIGSGNNGRSPT
jgi:hypothetical protein